MSLSWGATEKPEGHPPRSLGEKEAILAWAKTQKHSYRMFEFQHDQNEAVVLLIDRGSGVRLEQIYVYGKSKNQKNWNLVLFRPTDTEVKVLEREGKLIFQTVTDDVILEQSLDALGPFGERVRKQKEASKSKHAEPNTP